LDDKTAGFIDYLVPMPTSGAAKVNFLGDPVGTDGDIQRIVQQSTGGTFMLPVSPAKADESVPYRSVFASGYRPPSINPNRGYAKDGVFRPMTNDELSRYTVLRGQYLKEELMSVGETDDPKVVAAAYSRANARALSELGFSTKRAATAQIQQPEPPKMAMIARPRRLTTRMRSLRPRRGRALRFKSKKLRPIRALRLRKRSRSLRRR